MVERWHDAKIENLLPHLNPMLGDKGFFQFLKTRVVPIVIEVVSTNWRDDYYKKSGEYEGISIPEYWIVDYADDGGRQFIGNPKQPTILVCCLVEGEYQVSKFRGDDRIQSPTFPELNLTAQQIFQAGT